MQITETLSHDTILDNIPGGVAVFFKILSGDG
jgi:hypothetical protein